MKKFLINIAIFFTIVAVVDYSFGLLFHYLQVMAGGRTGVEFYACEKATEDVIIMGSSRASHHYVPEIISKRLGMSCFNAGQDGNGVILQYGRWKMLSKRYIPKMIIYDVTFGYDLAVNDNMTYVDRLKPYCYDMNIKNYICDIFPIERIKLISKLYRFNYKYLEILSDLMNDDVEVQSGYIPIYGELRMDAKHTKPFDTSKIDEVKYLYLDAFVQECLSNGVKLVFVSSPSYQGGLYGIDAFKPITDISSKYDVPFLYYGNSVICKNAGLFADHSHLNSKGAFFFSSVLADDIRQFYYQ